ncbi:TetR/AcrR family transcriptional regulator [Maribacter sp. 2308TA10-17]|uniref:TetR/AcrR family transcriptional regulator n=1 Tax=Maribacter sp. 2308TA10-17 TaxID=3386276 RepID=UPI0039BCBEC5
MSKKSKSRRQIIIEESAILFNSRGYSATSMKDIAEGVGVKAASLYNHISSKQEILSVLLLTIANKFYDGIKDVNNSSYSFKDKLREIIRMHIRVATENQNITALITQDWKHLEEPDLSKFIEIRTSYQQIFTEVIKQGMDSGELKSANLQITLNVILSSLRWIYDSELYNNTGIIGLAELERTILELVFKGIDMDN